MDAIALLQQRRKELARISPGNSRPINEWVIKTRPLFQQFFGDHVQAFDDISRPITHPVVWPIVADTDGVSNALGNAWETEKRQLASLVDGILEMQEMRVGSSDSRITETTTRKVFLVHGRNERWIHEVARFLESLHLTVVILREQPNSGRTVIEKFEEDSVASFAVVLLTGDDRGGLATEPSNKLQLRARQNVIFELGFLIGAMKRKSVCVLFEKGVEIPSDYAGVLWLPLGDDASWHLPLARELKSGGLEIDFNKLS